METKKLNNAVLTRVGDKGKNMMLQFSTKDGQRVTISTLHEPKDLKMGASYDLTYIEKQVDGYKYPFKNLVDIKLLPDVPVKVDLKPQFDKELVMTKLGCLRDAIAVLEMQKDLGQIKICETSLLYKLADEFYAKVTQKGGFA